MRTVTLEPGVELPVVGFGTWQLTGRKAHEATVAALHTGYRHIDTATIYGNEAEVGRALRDSGVPREDVFVTTKLPPDRAGRAGETLRASLDALGVTAVDLWLLHWPTDERRLVATWERLLAARADKLARAVGVSNFSLAQLDTLHAATGEYPAVNQIPWSPWQHSPETLAGHRDRGVVVEGYSPFKRSDLRSPVLAEVAAAHDRTPAQIVLAWHLAHDIVVIPKSATPQRIAENLEVTDIALTPDELARLDRLKSQPWTN